MSNKTTNYNLIKPIETEYYNIQNSNDNMDLIDAALKDLEDKKATKVTLNAVKETVTNLESTKADKTEIPSIPSSLPANGGNADTVGGKLPSAFANAVHTHTKADVGLSNVDNTADSAKSVKYATGAGNADTVDGYHVDGTLATQSLKLIYAGTSDLSAGVSPLSQGRIYIMYE